MQKRIMFWAIVMLLIVGYSLPAWANTYSFTRSTDVAGQVVSIELNYNNSNLVITPQDTISVKLDNFSVPSGISTGNIKINNRNSAYVSVYQNTVSVRTDQAENGYLRIEILSAAGIRNPIKDDCQITLTVPNLDPVSASFSVRTSVESVALEVYKKIVGTASPYVLGFKTVNELTYPNKIELSFPTGTEFSNLSATINNSPAFLASPSGTTLLITVPETMTISSGQQVTVRLDSPTAGIINPKHTGNYKITVKTDTDVIPVDTNLFTLTKLISNLQVIPSNTTYNAQVTYDIWFDLIAGGKISTTDNITVKFVNVDVPASIAKENILVNGVKIGGTETIGYGTDKTLTFNAPFDISSSRVNIKILGQGIRHTYGGNVQISLSTNTDPSPISGSYSLPVTAVSNVTVTPSSTVRDASTSYLVYFTTSARGMKSGETINIVFPTTTTMGNTSSGNYKLNVGTSVYNVTEAQIDSTTRKLSVKIDRDIPATTRVAVMIDTAAGMKNPTSAGSYQVSLNTSGDTQLVHSSSYSIVTGTLSVGSVTVSPRDTNTSAQYSFNITLGIDKGLTGGSGYIDVEFPSATSVPSSFSTSSIRVNSSYAHSVSKPSSYVVRIVVPHTLSGGSTVSLEISGITNPNVSSDSNYNLWVSTSAETTRVASPTYTIITTPKYVANVSTVVSPTRAGVDGRYTVTFKTGGAGALSGTSDTITIEFPYNTVVPSTIEVSKVRVNGRTPNSVYTSTGGRTVTIYLASGHTIGNNEWVTVEIEATAGIKNPTDSGNYRLKVRTSKDNNNVDSSQYTIVADISSITVALSPNGVRKGGAYTIDFKTGVTGALTGGVDSIQIIFPNDTVVPPVINRSHIMVNNTTLNIDEVVVSSREISFKIPLGLYIAADAPVIVKIGSGAGILNPSSAGTYTMQVSTTKETTRKTSLGYQVIAVTQSTPITSNNTVKLTLNQVYATINGQPKVLEAAPVSRDGRTLVPLRFVGEALNCIVHYDQAQNLVTISTTGKVIKIKLVAKNGIFFGEKAVVNNIEHKLDVPARIMNKRLVVPIRFVSETLGMKVNYHDQNKTIEIFN